MVFHIYTPNQALSHKYVLISSSGRRNCVEVLMCSIFAQGISVDSSTFFLFAMFGVVSGIDPNFSTWKIPDHISKGNYTLGKLLKPKNWYETIWVSNGQKYATLGDLNTGGSMINQIHSPFSGNIILFSERNLFQCEVLLHLYSYSIKNWMPATNWPPHTDPPTVSSRRIWHKVQLLMSDLKFMISSPVSPWDITPPMPHPFFW